MLMYHMHAGFGTPSMAQRQQRSTLEARCAPGDLRTCRGLTYARHRFCPRCASGVALAKQCCGGSCKFASSLAPLYREPKIIANRATLRVLSDTLCMRLHDWKRGADLCGSRCDADAGLRTGMVLQRQRAGVCARVHFARLLPQRHPAVAVAQHRRDEASGKVLQSLAL